MSDPKEPVRYHVVKHTLTLIHEYPQKYDDSAEFSLTENRCFSNVVSALEAAEEVYREFHLCSICASERAEYVGRFDTVEEAEAEGAFDMNPERIRARLSKPDTEPGAST